MLSKLLCIFCALALLFLWAGCGSDDVYEIELTPKGDQIERKLVMWVFAGETNEPSPKEVARVAPLYPNTFQPDHEKQRGFVGTFGERMPEDIGAQGRYVRYTNRMGTAMSSVVGRDNSSACQRLVEGAVFVAERPKAERLKG